MKIESSRFGTLELDDDCAITFPSGVIGFPDERCFVLLRRRPDSPIAWLQSTTTTWLALPVVSADALAYEYPPVAPEELAKAFGLDTPEAEYAVMVVLHAVGGSSPATVNLLAPLIVNAETRRGAQVMLEGADQSTQAPFLLANRRTTGRTDASSVERAADLLALGVQAVGA